MSVSLFASSALGSIGKELDNGKQTAKALFPTDAIMSAMLVRPEFEKVTLSKIVKLF